MAGEIVLFRRCFTGMVTVHGSDSTSIRLPKRLEGTLRCAERDVSME